MNKTAIYARKSTESEDRQILSIDSQVKELRDYASSKGMKIDRVLTESKSAKAPGRPVFNELVKLINRGVVEAVLAWKLDRLSRNPMDGAALVWALEQGRLKAIHTPQNSFSNTGNDKFWMQMEFGMASKFIYDLSDNTKRGLRAKCEQGWYPCRAPVGYINDQLSHTIVKDPERFALVRRMWDYILAGSYSPARIQQLAEHQWGLRTRQTHRQGGKPLSLSALYRTFHNPFYYGVVRYNGDSFRGSHVPMVSKSEFDRVQKLLGAPVRAKPHKRTFAFTGFIRCGECDCAITASHVVNRHGTHYEYYHCTKQKKETGCSQPAIRGEELERQFASVLDSLTLPQSYADFALELLRQTYDEEKKTDNQSIKAMNLRHEAIKRELSTLIDMKLRALLTEAEFVAKKQQLVEEQVHITELLKDANQQFKRTFSQTENVINLVAGLKDRFLEGDNQLKRNLVAATCCNPTILNKKLSIQVREPFARLERGISKLGIKITAMQPPNNRQGKRSIRVPDSAIVSWGPILQDLQTYFANEDN